MRIVFLYILLFIPILIFGKTNKYRASFHDDPSTTMIIGWNQVSGENAILYYDTKDNGVFAEKYTLQKAVDEVKNAKGMNNTFVFLNDLKPNTLYFFLIKDSEGVSKRMSFQTMPNSPEQRLSIAAGGDSRNMREARTRANKLIGKLRPHFVLFGGDMTDDDTNTEWDEWLDDWQYTMTPEGRLTPILPCRGNHEETNASITDIFGLNNENLYYALSFGGSLLRVYTLNSFIAPSGEQKEWLKNDLIANEDVLFKMAQYHLPMRPHVVGKESNQEQYIHWASLFGKHKVRLAIECDAHVAKYTYPLRPSQAADAVEGFVRDDKYGTVYIGEGCWGAPLRQANKQRTWTRNAEAFNQFHWIFIDKSKMEVRTVKTDCADKVVAAVSKNPFDFPQGLDIWRPSNGEVVVIEQHQKFAPEATVGENEDIDALPKLIVESGANGVKVSFTLQEMTDVKVKLFNLRLGEIGSLDFPNQPAGTNSQFVKLDRVPPGRYVLVIKSSKKPLGRYLIVKK